MHLLFSSYSNAPNARWNQYFAKTVPLISEHIVSSWHFKSAKHISYHYVPLHFRSLNQILFLHFSVERILLFQYFLFVWLLDRFCNCLRQLCETLGLASSSRAGGLTTHWSDTCVAFLFNILLINGWVQVFSVAVKDVAIKNGGN